MYSKSKVISSSKKDLSNYIEGYDLYNARLIDLLRDKDGERVNYTISQYEFRPDLIALEVYGDAEYMGFLYLAAGLPLESYTKGTVLSIYPKNVIEGIINSL